VIALFCLARIIRAVLSLCQLARARDDDSSVLLTAALRCGTTLHGNRCLFAIWPFFSLRHFSSVPILPNSRYPVERNSISSQGFVPLLLYLLQRRRRAAVRRPKHQPLSCPVSSHNQHHSCLPSPSAYTSWFTCSFVHNVRLTPRGISYPHVPAAIDLVSSDDYGDMSQVKNTRWFYSKFLYPKCGTAATAPVATARCSRLPNQRRFLFSQTLAPPTRLAHPPYLQCHMLCCPKPA
jgi:hypothetical protein